MKKIMALTMLAIACESCTTSDYSTVRPGEYQIAGNPYKSAAGCDRRAPVGKFDEKCDIPYLGYRNPYTVGGISVGAAAGGTMGH